MLDLHNKTYHIKELIFHIYAISLVDIYKTQILPKEFVTDYILNPEYQLTEEERVITIHDVLQHQRHLTMNDIFKSMKTSCKREKFDFSWL